MQTVNTSQTEDDRLELKTIGSGEKRCSEENHRHGQAIFFDTADQLPFGVKKIMDKSWATAFRKLVLEKIDERRDLLLFYLGVEAVSGYDGHLVNLGGPGSSDCYRNDICACRGPH